MAIGVTVPLKVLAQRVGASFLQARSIWLQPHTLKAIFYRLVL